MRAMREIWKNIQRCLAEDFILRYMHQNPDYDDRLNRHEFNVFSQSGEDGIIEEIFNKIGTTNKFFVEIGAGNGDISNTAYLLTRGWEGYWIEADKANFKRIMHMYANVIGQALMVKHTRVNAEDVETRFREAEIPISFDLLSIDIDGNDYWIWKAIEKYRSRVVVIEYNALYPPNVSWVMRYNPSHVHDGSKYHGASLKVLEELGREKDYQLVGCNFAGLNAFFVSSQIQFNRSRKNAAEYYYEPQRKWLINEVRGRRDFADFFEQE